MKYADARKLRNGDKVIAKDTGESVKVLNIFIPACMPYPTVIIEGVGLKSGRSEWIHKEIE